MVHRPKPAKQTLSKVTFHSPVDKPHCSCLGGLNFEEHHYCCLPVQFWAVSAKRWSFSPCRVLYELSWQRQRRGDGPCPHFRCCFGLMEIHAISGASVRPAKTYKLDWSSCLFHVRNTGSSLTNFGERSWRTLWRAAEVHRDKTFIFLRDSGADINIPRGAYHRECYQTYTNKKLLERLAANRGAQEEESECDADEGDCPSDEDDEVARTQDGSTRAKLQRRHLLVAAYQQRALKRASFVAKGLAR